MADKPPTQPPLHLKVKRRRSAAEPPYWQEYEAPFAEGKRLDLTLRECNDAPAMLDGCDDQSCGRCAMNVNNEPALLCAVKHGDVDEPIELRPLTVLPVVCDLVVSREPFAQRTAGLDAHGCIECGLCLEACPSYDGVQPFPGPAALYRAEKSGADPAQHPPHDCDNVQNCVAACPKELPIYDAIAALKRRAVRSLFRIGK